LKNKKIHEEILRVQKDVFNEQGELPFDTYKDNVDFQLYPMCIRESLRMFPPIIFLFRLVKKELKTEDGKIIPKGNIIAVSPALTGRHPEVYPNSETYDPYRWAEERNEHKKHQFSNLSFGAGNHRCIGENFALFQISSILSLFFKHLDMKFDSEELPSVNYQSLVAVPEVEDCNVQFVKKKIQN
jgi:sterol 14alpha-demethylase